MACSCGSPAARHKADVRESGTPSMINGTSAAEPACRADSRSTCCQKTRSGCLADGFQQGGGGLGGGLNGGLGVGGGLGGGTRAHNGKGGAAGGSGGGGEESSVGGVSDEQSAPQPYSAAVSNVPTLIHT